MTENYRGCYEYLSAQYPEVGGYEFYKELFPDNENSGERHTDFSHPNAVYLYRDEQSEDKSSGAGRCITTHGNRITWSLSGNSLTLCSGLAYRRKENRLENAQRMYALIFDLDGVGLAELRNLFLRFGGDPGECAGCRCRLSLFCRGQGCISTMFSSSRLTYTRI